MEIEGILYETATMGLAWKSIKEMSSPKMERGEMKKENELGIMIKCRKLIEYIFTITEKSPKKFRHTITAHLQNGALNIMEHLIRANEIYVKDRTQTEDYGKRLGCQKEAMIDIKVLGYMAVVAREQGCILPKQQEQIALQLSECRKIVGYQN